MNVNKNRLDSLIELALENCDCCPLQETDFCKLNTEEGEDSAMYYFNCEKAMYEWLQEFNVAEALEEGAHIVNGVAIFPPEEIPSQPNYGTPCEEVNRRGKADWWCEAAYCDYADCCPYL